jgi:hypothetical protein
MPYPMFDPNRLEILPLSDRDNLVTVDDLRPADAPCSFAHPALTELARRIREARANDRAVILSFGAHVIKQGMGPVLIDLVERGLVTLLATNGASSIHDFELALIGATSESVADHILDGRFGLWRETGRINDIVSDGVAEGMGYGESVGRALAAGDYPHKNISVFAAAARANVPLTVHIGIGYDIIHEHPNCSAAALGEASYRDYMIYTHEVERLEGGVFLNFGSAVMGPEIYLKALSMARNVARREGREIRRFTTAVFDLVDIGEDIHSEPPKDHPAYYFRPLKTILVRTVADGGESFYIQGDHRETLAGLRRELLATDLHK